MARAFTGADHIDCATSGDTTYDDRSSFTITAWVYSATGQATDFNRIISKRDGGTGLGWNFGNDRAAFSSTSLTFRVSGGTEAVASATGILTADTWVFVACSYDRTTHVPKIYSAGVSGVVAEPSYESQVTGATESSDAGGELVIGARNTTGSSGWTGRIADVRFFDGIRLSVNELNNVMRGAIVRPDTMIGWWELLGQSPEPDWSNSKKHGTVTGATSVDHPPGYSVLWFRTGGRRVERIGALPSQIYTREAKVSLPGNDTDLATAYSAQDYTDVASDNAVRVGVTGVLGYLIHEFKDKNTNNTDQVTLTWNGQSDVAPSTTSVRLQVYNRNSTTWETLATESSASANTDFTLTGSVTSNLSNYYDGSFYISGRVYQG